jgi:hypothetical protein
VIASTIIHFGLAKTGTTYLQEYLACNRDHLLSEHGILYPSGPANHYHVQSFLSSQPETLIQVRRDGYSTPAEARRFAKRFREQFEAEVAAAKPERLLISSEYFSSMNDEEFQALRAYFARGSRGQKAVVYMRDPWSHSSSAMQQNIRDGFMAAPLRMGYRKGQIQNIRRIESVFATDEVVVRPYLGGQGERTNIVDDFNAVIGITRLPREPQIDRAENRGIGRIVATLLAEFNRIWPQFDEKGLYKYSSDRDKVVRELLGISVKDDPLAVCARRAKIIYDTAKDDIDYIQEKYFGGERIFYDYYNKQNFKERDCEIKLSNLTNSESCSIIIHALEKVYAERS